MKSVTETIFFDSGIAPDLFGQYAIQIGDRDWWGMVGRLVAIVAGILKAWNVSDADALDLLSGTNRTSFETIVDRARIVLFASTYSVLAYSTEINSLNTWFHRPCRLWDGATPLAVMLKDASGLPDVFGFLEAAVSPVTNLAAEHL